MYKNTRKGQAAMEFLMTYGWALLVVLIAIAALAVFGLLNPSKFLPENCDLTPGLTCMDYNALTNDTDESDGDYRDNVTILLNNGIGQTMRNVGINISNCIENSTLDDPGSTGINDSIGNIAEGQTKRITVFCAGMPAESVFRSNMVLNYTTSVEGEELDHIKRGSISVQVDSNK